MATTTAARAGFLKPTSATGWASDMKRAWGVITVSTSSVTGDVFQMVKLPKGAVVIGGALKGDKLDSATSGSGALAINIGFDKAVQLLYTGTSVSSASTSNALASAWTLGGSGDTAAVTGYKPDAGVRNIPLGSLLLTDGPMLTTDETMVSVIVTATATAVVTGELILEVDYYMAQHS